MSGAVRVLTRADLPAVRRLFIDSFVGNAYFINISPDERERRAMFDREYAPMVERCVELGESYCWDDGGLRAVMLIAPFTRENADELDRVFFDFSFREGDTETLKGREALLDVVGKFGAAAYFFVSAVDARRRREGIGSRLIKHCVGLFPDTHIVCELTSPEMLALFANMDSGRKCVQQKISGHYVITTLEPRRAKHGGQKIRTATGAETSERSKE